MIKLLNFLTAEGNEVTVQVESPVQHLFDYCLMLQQQMQAGKLPITCKIHSIIPENSVIVELNKPIDSELFTQILEQTQELNFEQHKKLLTKYVAHSSLRQCPCCGSLFDVNHKGSTHQVNDLFGITFCSLDCSVKYTTSKIPYLKVEHKDVLNELIERLEEECIPKEIISEHFKS